MSTYHNDFGDVLRVRWFQNRINDFFITNSAVHGLQFVSLRLMYDKAAFFHVPFGPLGDSIVGKPIGLDDKLQKYYEALSDNTLTTDFETEIRATYAHISSNNETTAGVVHAHIPEPNARRRDVTM